MKPEDKLREMPGLLLFLIIICSLIALFNGWQSIAYDYGYSVLFWFWLIVAFLLFIMRMIVKRVIAVVLDNKR